MRNKRDLYLTVVTVALIWVYAGMYICNFFNVKYVMICMLIPKSQVDRDTVGHLLDEIMSSRYGQLISLMWHTRNHIL